MITCPTCQSTFSEDEAQADACPICGGSIETDQDRDIARSMAIPKNWAANLDALSDLFDSTDVAAVQAVMQANSRNSRPEKPEAEPEPKRELRESPVADLEELIEELSPTTATPVAEVAAYEPESDGPSELANTPAAPETQGGPGAAPSPAGPQLVEPPVEEPEPIPVDSAVYRTISNVESGVSARTSMKLDSFEPPSGQMFGNLASEGFGLAAPEEDFTKSQSFSRESLSVRQRSFADTSKVGDRSAEYQLLELLGEGGMGKVFKAKQTSIDREVAVKMLRKELDDADNQQKFLTEAVVTGDLNHPNIVPIYELGNDEKGDLFYSMKRVQGTPWDEVVSEKAEEENLEILMRVADAIAFAHSRGVIHRDLKPENIMLGSFGEVLVMDWGLALTTDVFNDSHGVQPEAGLGGTPVYMAPEMILADPKDITATADVYLLGAILYEILTGRPPHTGNDAQDCLVSVARNKIVPTDRKDEIVAIALQAMRTNPDERHQSVREFQEAVRSYQSHAESVALSARAGEDLQVARKSTDYQDFARALFGYQEAVELWNGNTKAAAGVIESRIAYASSAFEKGDYDLAASLPEAGTDVEDELLSRIASAQLEREAKETRLKVIRRVAAVLVLAVTCVVLGAFFWIRAEAQKAKAAEAIASKERDEADIQRESALVATKSAVEATKQAEKKTEEALTAEAAALVAKTAADAARKDAESERALAEKAKQAEEYEAYIAQIGLAAAKIEENAFDSAIQLLRRCRVDLRNWEWGRLMHLCSQSSQTIVANTPVDAIAISNDGTQAASGGWDGVARIHDLKTGALLHSLKHDGTYVYGVAFSTDGTMVATASDDKNGNVKIWNVGSGKLMKSFDGHGEPALSVQFSKDGTRLLTSSFDKTARLWDVAAGTEVQKFVGHMWWVWSATFSVDETQIVTASQDGTCSVWNAADGTRSAPFIGHEGPVYAAQFSPTGNTIVSAGQDNRVLLWDPAEVKPYNYAKLAAGEEVEPPIFTAFDGHTAAVRDVQFSADGKLLVSGSHDNTVKLWDIAAGRAVKTFRGHDRWVRATRFHPDGRSILSASHDEHIKTWTIADYEELRVLTGRVLTGHSDAVLGVNFSKDSESVVTCSRDRSAKTWSTETGEPIQTFAEGHSFLASSVVFFSGGQKLLTAAVDNTARVWDLRTGTEAMKFEGTGRSAAVALSSDGKWVLTGGEGNLANLWNAATGENIKKLDSHQVQVTAVAFSPDGNTLLTGDARGRCVLWNRESGQPIHQLTSHTRRITEVAFLPDGQHALTASGDKSVGCWDIRTGEELTDRILKHPDAILAMTTIGGSDRVLTTCADGFVRLWDSATGDALGKFSTGSSVDGHVATLNTIVVSADGTSVLTVDPQKNLVHKWKLTGDELEPVASIGGPAVSDSATPLIQRASGTGTGRVRPFLNLNEEGGLVWSATLSPDGNQVVTVGGNGARLWDARTAKEQLSLTPHSAVASAVFSPDGTQMASGSWDNSAKIWDVATGKAIHKLEGVHTAGVTSVNFSHDGQLVVTGSDDATIATWDTVTGECVNIIKGHRAGVNSAEFGPEDRLILTGSIDRTARLWDVQTGQQVGIIRGHEWAITAAAFSPDGNWIITGSEDTTARVWNAKTQEERLSRPLGGHTAAITSVAFSPDGQRVMTASKDYTAKLWDAETGKEILTLSGHTREITSVAFSPNGRYVMTGSQDGNAIIWLSLDWKQPGNVAFGDMGRGLKR